MKKEPHLSIDAIKRSDKIVHFYTGLETYDVFSHKFWSLGDNFNHRSRHTLLDAKCLSSVNWLLFMLVKPRRHYLLLEFARILKSSVSNFSSMKMNPKQSRTLLILTHR